MAGTVKISAFGLRICRKVSCRQFSRTIGPRLTDKPVAAVSGPGNSASHKAESGDGDISDLAPRHRPTKFDKYVLVSAKMFESMDAVPEVVSYPKMRRAKDMFRVRGMMFMVGAAVMGCILMIWSGRRARDAGESLDKRGKVWMEKMRQQGIKEREMAAAKE